jgi:hypothetical protein
MFSALFSFLGGAAFRMVWGEISAWLNKRQDHKYEIERLKVEGEMDAARHQRQQETIRLQSKLGIKEIQIAGDVAVTKVETDAWFERVKAIGKPIGIKWVDAWNASITPAAATIALGLWILKLYQLGFNPQDWDHELIAAVLGLYIADRRLQKRGK